MGKEIACSAKERYVYVRSVGLFFKKNLLAKRIFLDVSGCGGFLNGSERVVTGKIHLDGCEIVFIAEGDAAFIVNLEKSVIVGLTHCGLSLDLRRRHGTGRDSPEVRQAISACFVCVFVYKENGLVFCGSCSRAEHGKDGRAGTDGEVPVSMILRRAKEEFGAVVPLVDASDL